MTFAVGTAGWSELGDLEGPVLVQDDSTMAAAVVTAAAALAEEVQLMQELEQHAGSVSRAASTAVSASEREQKQQERERERESEQELRSWLLHYVCSGLRADWPRRRPLSSWGRPW